MAQGWGNKGFGTVTPDSAIQGTYQGPGAPPPSPDGGRRSRRITPRVIAVIGAFAVVVVVAAILFSGGKDTADSGSGGPGFTVRAAHGPSAVVDGVPTGYTRDQEGAATAAVNVVQALTQAGQGRIDIAKVQSALVAKDPGPGLTKSIGIGSDRAEEKDVLNVLPAAVTVTALTQDSAKITIWKVGVSRASIQPGDPVSVMTVWSTSEVSLVWQDGDWKAQDAVGHSGPTPDEVVAPDSDSPLTKPLLGGYYSFYVN